MPDIPEPTQPWNGETYYGRPQVKPAPFNIWLVGSYIFLAGLSGGAQVLATIMDNTRGPEAAPTIRRARWLALLAPTLGATLLVLDLHTPKRFYNMLRVFKATSPMSIGSWLLMGFSGTSMVSTLLHGIADSIPPLAGLRRYARMIQVPAALTGAGMCTYTAALLSATSTPRWAISPRNLAVRFGAASMASAAAFLSLREQRGRVSRDLDAVTIAALAAEVAALLDTEKDNLRYGIEPPAAASFDVASAALPMGVLTACLLLGRAAPRAITTLASLGVLTGSWAMRVGILHDGAQSAKNPEISMRVAQPDNLPRAAGTQAMRPNPL